VRIETLLNRVFWLKSFVYEGVSIQRIGRRDAIVVDIRHRKNSRPECSRCGKEGPVYDHMPDHRQFEFIPLLNIPVFGKGAEELCFSGYLLFSRIKGNLLPELLTTAANSLWNSSPYPISYAMI